MENEVKEGEEEKRVKRDEWSDGAVDSLLESYEEKWVLRNRAKLKGQDWEDVATQVSSREGSNVKTATQCKNKIESMKKRYRNEVAAGNGKSRWPLFSRIDGLVKCRTALPTAAPDINVDVKPFLYDSLNLQPVDQVIEIATQVTDQEVENKPQPDATNKEAYNKAQSQYTEANKEAYKKAQSQSTLKENRETESENEKRKREKYEEGNEIAESIKWFGDIMLRVEQTRMEGMKEVEKIRAETEARKSEMELKRIEIISSTQLEIAKLFARRSMRK